MIYMAECWKKAAVLVLLLLITGLVYVGSPRAQLKKDEVDFEVLATVTAQKGEDCCLWNMAEKYYGDAHEWEYIRKMNKIPNERAISVGTVIYIPVKDAKKIVKAAEAEIEEKKVVEKEISTDIDGLREELDHLRSKLKKCEDENKKLAERLKKCEDEKKRLARELKKCKEAGAKSKRLADELKKKDAII
jgi:peptidoglycan hydrolase CwlO-like protein